MVSLYNEYAKSSYSATFFSKWDSPMKMTGVLVENFKSIPKKVPESGYVCVAQINFYL